MNCTELIELFNKVGGVLTCNYDKEKVWVDKTNLKCDIKQKDYEKLEILAHDFAFSPYKLEHLKYNLNDKNTLDKNTLDKIVNTDIKNKNRYMSNDEYGYKITFIDGY